MKELLSTNNTVRLSYATALLRDRGLSPVVFDQHMSAVEGSISGLPRRLMIDDTEYDAARRILTEWGVLEAGDSAKAGG